MASSNQAAVIQKLDSLLSKNLDNSELVSEISGLRAELQNLKPTAAASTNESNGPNNGTLNPVDPAELQSKWKI